MEYFKIETVEELKQAYSQLKWSPSFNLEKELYYFNEDSLYRWIAKNSQGCLFLTKESYLPTDYTEIPNPLKSNKYSVECKGVQIDVYDVLKSFDVRCPATQHAIKKLLKTGKRGYKDAQQDLTEAIESINRAKQLRNE